MRYVKNKFGDIIYCVRDDGTITDKFDCDVVGHLKNDRITDKFDVDTLYRIRPDGTVTDKYDCDIIGHIDIQKRTDVSNTGCLGVIFSSIWYLVLLILRIVVYYFILGWMSYTVI